MSLYVFVVCAAFTITEGSRTPQNKYYIFVVTYMEQLNYTVFWQTLYFVRLNTSLTYYYQVFYEFTVLFDYARLDTYKIWIHHQLCGIFRIFFLSVQIEEFRRLRSHVKGAELLEGNDGLLGDNFRPTQPLSDRTVRASFQWPSLPASTQKRWHLQKAWKVRAFDRTERLPSQEDLQNQRTTRAVNKRRTMLHFLTRDSLLMDARCSWGTWVLWNHIIVEQALEELTQFSY